MSRSQCAGRVGSIEINSATCLSCLSTFTFCCELFFSSNDLVQVILDQFFFVVQMVEMLFGRGLVKVSFVLCGLSDSEIIWCLDQTYMATGVYVLATTQLLTRN